MTKLINDKTDLVTLLSLQNWPRASLIPKAICPYTSNDVLKNAIDEMETVKCLT